MEKSDFIKRIEDLAARCEKNSGVTFTSFLTPAEQYELSCSGICSATGGPSLLLSGGGAECERKIAFFLPWYMEPESFEIPDYICALKLRSFFGEPGHRDYLGAVLGLGISRDRIGDIIVLGDTAYLYCLPGIKRAVLELEKVGRCGVKVSELPLSEVPAPEREVRKLSFTVKSLRLDAVVGDMFGVSRTKAAEFIRLGAVSLNYSVCEKTDAEVRENDVISLRGKGKGCITSVGGKSKKDRLFIEAEILK